MAASATLALKAGVWFRRARLCMVSPDSQAIACLPSGRNSTYRPVQISGATSVFLIEVDRLRQTKDASFGVFTHGTADRRTQFKPAFGNVVQGSPDRAPMDTAT